MNRKIAKGQSIDLRTGMITEDKIIPGTSMITTMRIMDKIGNNDPQALAEYFKITTSH